MTPSPALDRVQQQKRKKMEHMPGYKQTKELTQAMRDFTLSINKTTVEIYGNLITDPPKKSPSPVDLDDLEYIDAEVTDEMRRRSAEESAFEMESQNRRLRRSRWMSKKVRCPKLKDDPGGSVDRECTTASLDDLTAGFTTNLKPDNHSNVSAPSSPSSPSLLPMHTLAVQSTAVYFSSSPECYQTSKVPVPPPGPRYKLITEGVLKVCSQIHSKTVLEKIIFPKLARKWESHFVFLTDQGMAAKVQCGLLCKPVKYDTMQLSKRDYENHHCIRVAYSHGILLLRANSDYSRDQWYNSILWKQKMAKYRNAFMTSNRIEVILDNLGDMVDSVLASLLQDEQKYEEPLNLITDLLLEEKETIPQDKLQWQESIIKYAAPILSEANPSPKICTALAKFCRLRPRTKPLPEVLAAPIRRILKHNVDFGRAPQAKQFVQDYIGALDAHSKYFDTHLHNFVELCHGPHSSNCPHPRALPNLVSVALSALNDCFRDGSGNLEDAMCYAKILFLHVPDFDDWRAGLAALLQPVPFIPEVFNCPKLSQMIRSVLSRIAGDERCIVHSCLLAPRTGREGWLHAAAPHRTSLKLPHGISCKLWGDMLASLLNCCCRRKSFLDEHLMLLPSLLIVALTEHPTALEALCLILEWKLPIGQQTKLEVITTLKGTDLGLKYYNDLLERKKHLKELLSEGGPKLLALPIKATDNDLKEMLAAGKFGNLEGLSLAFTCITSASAYQLIKLPSLRYLNLWATQFDDSGVQIISDHLTKLQVLNLCETPISDKGIEALASLKNLERLNLNSTKLTTEAYERLKIRLPNLKEFDIRYTEAW